MKYLFALLLIQSFFVVAFAQDRRALVIGIDTYAPPANVQISPTSTRLNWPTLDGCKNDADLVKALILSRFSFTENNIVEIVNTDATRNNILKGMNDLLTMSNKNDVAFIYYAGHGSQVKNSLSPENDKKDESIVPVDTWKAGVPDIRDKELAKLFNRFIDKGIILTVIFDCCHSGSMARGLYPLKSRYIGEQNYDVKDTSAPVPPESRKNSGYLILSASQDNENAQEQYDDNDHPHGAFTLALAKAIDQQSLKTSSQDLFIGIRAILKSSGNSQEPVLAGDPSRFDQTIFGLDKATLNDKRPFAVLEVSNDNKVILQGGLAAGINVGNELAAVNGKSRIRVSNVLGISQSEATIISATADTIKPGELFEVTNWVPAAGPLLKVYVPGGKYSYNDVMKLAGVNAQLKRSTRLNWINNFDKTVPDIAIVAEKDHFMLYDYARGQAGTKQLVGYDAASIEKMAQGKNLFVNLPPTDTLITALQVKFSEFKTIRLVDQPAEAQYILYGTIDNNGNPAYGFMKANIELRDSLSTMPLFTKYFTLADNKEGSCRQLVGSLFEISLKLSKIRGWLTLSTPMNAGNFPYHLSMHNKLTGKPIDASGVKVGDRLALYIEANADYLAKEIEPKYIYVFTIDISGKMQLMYPFESEGSSQNKFPFLKDGAPVKNFIISDDMQAADPVGTDNYFLIASKEPLTGFNKIFNQDGVRGIGPTPDPLSALLDMGNETTARGIKIATPATWNLLRLAVKTSH